MKVHKHISDLNINRPIVTVGFFDGMHQGHQDLLRFVNAIAKMEQGETVVLSFWPHPRKVLGIDDGMKLLNTIDEKIELIEKNGIDHLILVPFTKEFSALSPDEFIKQYLIDLLNISSIIIGHDHHFGKGRQGDIQLLESYTKDYSFSVHEVKAKILEHTEVSSTKIRQALETGDIHKATEFLGYEYFISGEVIKGRMFGRILGFRTANIELDFSDKLIPLNGIYACRVEVRGCLYGGMMNIGNNPTVTDGSTRSIEVHIFDFSADIYGEKIRVYFVERIRTEVKFESIEALKNQMINDDAICRRILDEKLYT